MSRASEEKANIEAAQEAMKILKKPGVYIRETNPALASKFRYQAILPGDWTSFECRGLTEKNLDLLLTWRDVVPDPPRHRWIARAETKP